MAHPLLIVCGAVAAVILILITGSMFGVSRRAVEAEMRRAEDDDDDAGGHRGERRGDLAA